MKKENKLLAMVWRPGVASSFVTGYVNKDLTGDKTTNINDVIIDA